MGELRKLQKAVHELAQEKGWYDGAPDIATAEQQAWVNWLGARLALVHSEVSEALECVRRGQMARTYKHSPVDGLGDANKPEGLPTELADVVIRVLDLCESLGIDLELEIVCKHAFNRTRESRHGGKKL